MTDKRKYTEILRDLDTKMATYNITIQYVNNHLKNIDQHMEKINTTNLEQEVKIAKVKFEADAKIKRVNDSIALGYKVGGGLLSALSLAVVALILRLLGVY